MLEVNALLPDPSSKAQNGIGGVCPDPDTAMSGATSAQTLRLELRCRDSVWRQIREWPPGRVSE